MPYITPHNWVGGETATEALLDEINNNLRALFPVGSWKYLLRAPTTTETYIDNCWLECNGVSVLRATYPDLNTLLAGLGYPFGTADGTHMTLPDAQGRMLVSAASGGHSDVNALGDSDGYAKALRTPVHDSTVSVGGGSLSGAPSINDPGHSHSYSHMDGSIQSGGGAYNAAALNLAGFSTGVGYTGITAGIGTLAVSGIYGSGLGGGGSSRPLDRVPYLVGGVLFIKAVA